MKRLIKFGSVGLVIAGAAIAVGGEAFAQVPALSTRPDGSGAFQVIIFGSPRTQVPIALSGSATAVSKSFRANGCGHIIIPAAANYSGLNINGNPIGTASVLAKTPIAPPTCQGTESSTLPVSHDTTIEFSAMSQSWNIGDGKILVRVPVEASAPNGRFIDATYQDNSPKQRFVTLNGCGLGTVSKVSASALIAVNNGTAQAVNGLPTSNGLRCLGDKVTGSESDFSSSFPSPLPDVYKDASNNIYFKTSAGATVPVGLAAQSATRSVTSDRCGGLTVGSATRPQDTPFTINGVSIDPASLSVGLKPSCKLSGGSYAYDVEPTGNFKTSSGQVFVKTTTANPTGFGDRRILSITTSGSATRNLKANACGIASIRSTSSAPITGATEFSHNGNNYTVTDLPVHTASCVNAGTSASPNYQLFRALN